MHVLGAREVEAVGAAAVTVLGAVPSGRHALVAAEAASTTAVVVAVVLLLVPVFLMPPLAPALLRAARQPIPGLLCSGFVGGEIGQDADEGESRQDTDQPAAGLSVPKARTRESKCLGSKALSLSGRVTRAPTGERTDEMVKGRGNHGTSPCSESRHAPSYSAPPPILERLLPP
jgi:hypothetical protein